ncbi:hypothetical protein CLU79DRAFT_834542 [Phycomyces nitens]|nr:hypothetical protein CLU79DRAFT_834542 [Phycomyces nitens]
MTPSLPPIRERRRLFIRASGPRDTLLGALFLTLLYKKYPTRRLVSFMREGKFDPVDQTTIAHAVQNRLHFPEHSTTIRGSLVIYGQIIDVGIYREPKYNTFLGTGYALLQTS